MSTTERDDQLGSAKIPQMNLGTILLMFGWPAAWYMVLIYGIGARFVTERGTTPTWVFLAAIVFGAGAELVAGLVLLHREGYSVGPNTLRDRIRLRWPSGWRAWIVALIVLALGMGLGMAAGPLNAKLATVPGFVPPSWWPGVSNPTIQVQGASDVFPDINLRGNYLFVLLYFTVGLVFNILGEEIYYRGYLLPRMRGVFGAWDWIANGILFTLKHVYQRWMYPGILVGGLSFAFAAGPLASLPLAMVFHWVGNFLLSMIFLVAAAAGAA
jgi:membrane protease YdiL (CAAX protease family)